MLIEVMMVMDVINFKHLLRKMGGELGQIVSQADVNDNFEDHLGILADGQVVGIWTSLEIILQMARCNRWFGIRLDGYWLTQR